MKRTLLFILLIFTVSIAPASQSPKPPAQPATGPGGAEYKHASALKQSYNKGADEYWIFEPNSPKPETAPVIVFNHGWGGTNPAAYGAWIDHLVKRGNIVIYPRYQADLRTPVKDFTPNAVHAVKDALRRLQSEPGHVKPDTTRFAIAGHSVGGILTANLAALAREEGLPQPRAVMSVEPGNSWIKMEWIAVPIADLKKIPKETLLLAVAGDRDQVVRDIDAKRIFNESAQVPRENKNLIVMVSDDHGLPALEATHFAPCGADQNYDNGERRDRNRAGSDDSARSRIRRRIGMRGRNNFASGETGQEKIDGSRLSSRTVDALDYYGTWKLFDALCDAAFYNKNRSYALGNTPEQRFMGKWSDGAPVKELKIAE